MNSLSPLFRHRTQETLKIKFDEYHVPNLTRKHEKDIVTYDNIELKWIKKGDKIMMPLSLIVAKTSSPIINETSLVIRGAWLLVEETGFEAPPGFYFLKMIFDNQNYIFLVESFDHKQRRLWVVSDTSLDHEPPNTRLEGHFVSIGGHWVDKVDYYGKYYLSDQRIYRWHPNGSPATLIITDFSFPCKDFISLLGCYNDEYFIYITGNGELIRDGSYLLSKKRYKMIESNYERREYYLIDEDGNVQAGTLYGIYDGILTNIKHKKIEYTEDGNFVININKPTKTILDPKTKVKKVHVA